MWKIIVFSTNSSLYLLLLQTGPSSETQGQIVGARESLNGRENMTFSCPHYLPLGLRGWRGTFTPSIRLIGLIERVCRSKLGKTNLTWSETNVELIMNLQEVNSLSLICCMKNSTFGPSLSYFCAISANARHILYHITSGQDEKKTQRYTLNICRLYFSEHFLAWTTNVLLKQNG